MSSDTELVGELDHLLFTIDGQAICSVGKNIFDETKLKEMPTFLSGLITGVRSFSHLLERNLQIITVIGQREITRVVVSPEYVIEPLGNRDLEQVLFEKRMGRMVWEETGWKKEPQRGLCIGFKASQSPFWVDFPDVTQGFRLYFLREMAENFYTAFAKQIRKYDFNFDVEQVKRTIGWNGGRSAISTIDLGYPVFVKQMEATVIFTETGCSMKIDAGLVESQTKSEVMCSTAATLYTGLNHAFGFAENEKQEGWMVVDFGGTEAIGSSLFVFGKEMMSQGEKACILSLAVANKDKYVFGGKGDVSSIMRGLRDRTREIADQKSPKILIS